MVTTPKRTCVMKQCLVRFLCIQGKYCVNVHIITRKHVLLNCCQLTKESASYKVGSQFSCYDLMNHQRQLQSVDCVQQSNLSQLRNIQSKVKFWRPHCVQQSPESAQKCSEQSKVLMASLRTTESPESAQKHLDQRNSCMTMSSLTLSSQQAQYNKTQQRASMSALRNRPLLISDAMIK